MITVFGIRQCDTCRKALRWLQQNNIDHQFHDLRSDGLEPGQLEVWMASPLAPLLVNRRSTTWRGLDDALKAARGPALAALLLSHPTLIKRPLIQCGDKLLAVGFKPAELEALL